MERKHFTFFRQARKNTCAVAALRSVLATQFGVSISEDLLCFAGTKAEAPIVQRGCETADMRRMLRVANVAKNFGPVWRLKVFSTGDVKDLASIILDGRLPIVEVKRFDKGEVVPHCVVVFDAGPGGISYFDPETGRCRHMLATKFLREWTNERDGRWCAVVTGGLLGNPRGR